jgi:hypothetical protein
MYRRLPSRRSIFSYLLPYLILGAFVVLAYLGLKWWTKDAQESLPLFSNTVSGALTVERGSAEILLFGSREWKASPRGLKIFKGDAVRTGDKARTVLNFFENKFNARLGDATQVALTELKEDGSQKLAGINLEKGDLWLNLPKDAATADLVLKNSEVSLQVGRVALTRDQDIETIRVLSGFADVQIFDPDLNEKKVLLKLTVGVGQQIKLTQNVLALVKSGKEVELISALDDEFKATEWFVYNDAKDGVVQNITAISTGSSLATEIVAPSVRPISAGAISITSPAQDYLTNQKSVTVKGTCDTAQVAQIFVNGVSAKITAGNWSVKADLNTEGLNILKIETEDLNGVKRKVAELNITRDTTAPEAPLVKEPTAENRTIKTGQTTIKGTTETETAKIIVNDYALQKFKAGDLNWSYAASESIGNLKVGDNEFKIIAVDAAGNLSPAAIISIRYDKPKETPKTATGGSTISTTTVIPSSASTEPFPAPQITSPADGTETEEASLVITGTTAASTDAIYVNDYKLQKFISGGNDWSFYAAEKYSNYNVGKNVYRIYAVSQDGRKSEAAVLTVTRKK